MGGLNEIRLTVAAWLHSFISTMPARPLDDAQIGGLLFFRGKEGEENNEGVLW